MKWHYEKDGNSAGPVPYEEIEDLFRTGQIGPDTLVWRPGMTKWIALNEVEELKAVSTNTPPPLPGAALHLEPDELQMEPSEADTITLPPAAPLAGPWTRYFARMIDIFVLSTVVGAIAYLAASFISLELLLVLDRTNPVVFNLIALPFGLMLNTVIITLFGNSLGKTIFGIKMVPIHKFGLLNNFYREMRVWGQGLGLGIPIVTLFTLAAAYKKVSAGQPTGYDLGWATVRDLSGNKIRRAAGMLLGAAMVAGATIFNVMDKQAIDSLARPSSWTNPITQRQTVIPAQWRYEFVTGPDNNPLYSFTQMQTGRAAFLAVEDLPSLDLTGYSSTLASALSDNLTLMDWEWSQVSTGVMEASGWTNDGNKPVIIYTLQHEGRFWRIVILDEVKPLPNDKTHLELVRALLDSVGYR